jgi:hypothetical protein
MSETVASALESVKELYTNNLNEYGVTSRSVGWPDPEAQILRFQKLASIIEPNGISPISINDWGCGYGSMFDYLKTLGLPISSYYGYDVSPEMISAAEARIKDPAAEWIVGADVATAADYTFVSGTFNVRFDAIDSDWDSYIKQKLRDLYAQSKHGIAFNLLTSYVDWREPHLFYADPSDYFEFCKTELSRYVTLLHDYPLYEWTILVRRRDET